MTKRNMSLRHSLPKELLPSSKLTDKRFQFILPSVESRMSSTQTYSRCVSVHDNRLSNTYNLGSERMTPQRQRGTKSAGSSVASTPKHSSRQVTENEDNTKKQTILEDETCISLRQKYIGQDQPDFSQEEDIDSLKLLLEHLKVYTLSEASKGNYEEGRRSEKLTQELNNYLYHAVHDRTRSLSPRTQFQEELKQKQQQWSEEIKEFDEETAHRNEELDQAHQRELDEFNEKWQQGDFLKYRKPSGQLLNLWRMEKFLAKQKKLDDAERIHKEAEQLSKKETARAKKALDHDYQSQLQKLKEKQASEKEQLNSEREADRKYMLLLQSKENDCYTNKGNVIECRLKEPFRTKEAQKTIGSRDTHRKKQYAAPEVSFAFQTTLPPLQPPVSAKSTHSDENNESKDEKKSSSSSSSRDKK